MSPIDVKGGERARIRDGFPRTNCCSFGLVQVFQMGAGEGGGGRYFGQNPKEKQFCLGKPSHWGKPIYEVFFLPFIIPSLYFNKDLLLAIGHWSYIDVKGYIWCVRRFCQRRKKLMWTSR